MLQIEGLHEEFPPRDMTGKVLLNTSTKQNTPVVSRQCSACKTSNADVRPKTCDKGTANIPEQVVQLHQCLQWC